MGIWSLVFLLNMIKGDPESKDALVMILVTNPINEPRIHRYFFRGLDDLYVYTQEVVAGVHDYLVEPEGWSYSYHDRVCNWPGIDGWSKIEALIGTPVEISHVDQIDKMIKMLAKTP
jgi:thymidylate synthase